MKTCNLSEGLNVHVHGDPPIARDSYARESFTWRRMEAWQAWTLGVSAVVLTTIGLVYLSIT